MENTLVDDLNKLLTNTLEYQEVLKELAEKVSDSATKKKLEELADVKKKQAEDFIKIIPSLGGKVESSERIMDQDSVSWVIRPLPNQKNVEEIFFFLIETEQKARQDYQNILSQNDLEESIKRELEIMFQEADNNIKNLEKEKEYNNKK